MEGRLKVVEVWAIPIRVHFSWLLVFGLVAWSLAAGYFPAEYPSWAARTYWAVGAITALVFFACILVHELGHSWVALRNGIPIRSITLFVFGVAHIGEPSAPGAPQLGRGRPIGAWPGPAEPCGNAALSAGSAWQCSCNQGKGSSGHEQEQSRRRDDETPHGGRPRHPGEGGG